jgi:hypothetical protein
MSDELLASDAEREQAVARLREASAEGRLTLDELAQRTGDAYAARTHADLVHVTAGLPPAKHGASPAPRSERAKLVLGVFAPVRRKGRWRLARRTIVVSLFAPAWLDLREATLEDGETAEITVVSVFGPINLRVPERVALETSVVAIFGPVHETGAAGPVSPAAPRVRVNGLSLFGPTFVRLG